MSESVDYSKVLFGCHAMQAAGQFFIQEAYELPDGRYITSMVAIMVSDGPLISPEAKAHDACQELIVGDCVIRPHGKWTSRKYVGYGLASIVTSEAMFPQGHEIQTLDNGYEPITKRTISVNGKTHTTDTSNW